MKTNTIQIISLEASDGMVLTNGETYSKQIYLGTMDSADNWWEIPESEVPEQIESEIG